MYFLENLLFLLTLLQLLFIFYCEPVLFTDLEGNPVKMNILSKLVGVKLYYRNFPDLSCIDHFILTIFTKIYSNGKPSVYFKQFYKNHITYFKVDFIRILINIENSCFTAWIIVK